jgi:hypothetical protein
LAHGRGDVGGVVSADPQSDSLVHPQAGLLAQVLDVTDEIASDALGDKLVGELSVESDRGVAFFDVDRAELLPG